MRWRTTPTAAQEAVAQAKAMARPGSRLWWLFIKRVIEQAHRGQVLALRQDGALGTRVPLEAKEGVGARHAR
jgi:hypothetical protein